MHNQIITVLDTHPVLLTTVEPDFNLAQDWAYGEDEMRTILDTHPGKLFIIIDMREMKIGFDDLMVGASLGGRGNTPLWHHPNVQGIYFISESKLVALAAAGLHSPVFGGIPAKVRDTVEEALTSIDRDMAG